MAQTYVSTGSTAHPAHMVADEGGTLILANVGGAELDYRTAIRTGDKDLFAELQDLVALFCRASTGNPSTGGLSTGTAQTPYPSVTPREVLLRLSLMINNMLSSPPV
jgi:hypothetical protein